MLGKLYVSNAGDSRAVLCQPVKKNILDNAQNSQTNIPKVNCDVDSSSNEHSKDNVPVGSDLGIINYIYIFIIRDFFIFLSGSSS